MFQKARDGSILFNDTIKFYDYVALAIDELNVSIDLWLNSEVKQSTQRKTYPSVVTYTSKPTWTGMG